MNILICNVGSTSLKYQLFAMDQGERVIGRRRRGAGRCGRGQLLLERRGKNQTEDPLPSKPPGGHRGNACQTAEGEKVDCVGFKVVHARGVTGVQYLNDEVLSAMEAFNSVAPAHNPPYLAAIRQFRALMPGTPLVGAL